MGMAGSLSRSEDALWQTLDKAVEPFEGYKAALRETVGACARLRPLLRLRLKSGAPIDRDLLLVPELVAEAYDLDIGRTLRPIFDTIWSAAGYSGSLNYDPDGNWRPYC